MRPRLVVGLVLAACAGRPSTDPGDNKEPLPSTNAPAAFPFATRPPVRREHIQVKATDHGIMGSYGPMTHVLFTAEVARLLRTDGECIYFVETSAPVLRVLCPRSDSRSRKILRLDPIDHPSFRSRDPLAFLQRQEDLSVDSGVLCLDLHDRPSQPSATYNIRVDLVRGTHVRHLVEDLARDSDGLAREPIRPRLCTAHGPSAHESSDGTYLSLDL
ncbi:MAG TPA: hypothetical protein VGB85_34265 [Nannocystis sp.]|jgi:hypothetical protein